MRERERERERGMVDIEVKDGGIFISKLSEQRTRQVFFKVSKLVSL